MEIFQRSFLQVPLNNLSEIYQQHVLPRLTKKNKVIAITAAILLTISYKLNKILRPPKRLRHIPYQSYSNLLSSLLGNKSFLERAQCYGLPLINSKESNGLYLRPGRFGWEVQITNPEAAKHVFLKHDKFPKLSEEKANHNSLFYKFVGRPNIVIVNGEHWKDQRKITNPAFHRSMPVHLFGKLTLQLFEEMEKLGTTVDVPDLMERWTLDAIGKAGFDFNFNALTDRNNIWVNTYNTINTALMDPLHFFLPILEKHFMWLLPKRKYAHRELANFRGMITSVIEEKRRKVASGENHNINLEENEKDLLTLMLESEMKGEGKMTNDELEANICVFFLAGHDTTASALSSAICYLALDPIIQQRAREEAISILGNEPEDVLPTIEDTKKMTYINQIMKETLRINGPAAMIVSRLATEDCELAGTFIPKGTPIAINLYETMHSEKNWNNALKFDPDRFAADGDGIQVAGRGFSWIPFGNGARQCIGMNFSLAEQRVMLSMLLRKYTWKLPNDSIHRDGLKASGLAVIGPKDLKVEFTKIY